MSDTPYQALTTSKLQVIWEHTGLGVLKSSRYIRSGRPPSHFLYEERTRKKHKLTPPSELTCWIGKRSRRSVIQSLSIVPIEQH
jgi:hypothetical protein